MAFQIEVPPIPESNKPMGLLLLFIETNVKKNCSKIEQFKIFIGVRLKT
jgi:hypothetical protein